VIPKGHASSSFGVNPNEPVRNVNVVRSLRCIWEIDNQVGNSNKPCKYLHNFFQNSSSSFSSLETSSSSKLGDATDSIPSDSINPLPFDSSRDKKEPEEKDSTISVDPLPPKGSSSPSFAEKVYKPSPPFPTA